MFKNYMHVMQHLDSLGLFHMDLSLSRVKNALKSLKLEQQSCMVVQIVGTNGKGSTASFLASLAHAHGISYGLFTSPHLVSPKERIICNNQVLDEDTWVILANRIYAHAPSLTYFEFLTVLALLAFVEKQVDLIILEAGLGGRYDATSAIAKDILCLTPISLDHEAILGPSLEHITHDKACAITHDITVYCATQPNQILEIIRNKCDEKQAKLVVDLSVLPKQCKLGLKGTHQESNARLALSAWQSLACKLNCSSTIDIVLEGLAKAFIAGRLQSISPHEAKLPTQLLLDGAHNMQGLDILISYLESCHSKPNFIIFSCMADKNMQAMQPRLVQLHAICNNCPLVIVGLQDNERALSLNLRTAMVQELSAISSGHIYTLDNLSVAFEHARLVDNAKVLICGSLYLLGEFYAMYPHYLRKR